MTTLDLIDYFRERCPPSWWPFPQDDQDTPFLLAAAVSLSGHLDQLETEGDIREALEDTFEQLSINLLSTKDLAHEAARIEEELDAWGREVDDQLRRIAESN